MARRESAKTPGHRKKTPGKKTSVSDRKPVAGKTGKAHRKASLKKKVAGPEKQARSGEKIAAKRETAGKRPVSRKKIADKGVAKEERAASLKKALLGRKGAILKEVKQEIAKYMSGETRQLVDTALDDGDWAVVDLSEDISLRRLSAHRKMLHEIDEAVRKINEGTYGICEECGEEISEKRLNVLPAATLCVDCQENKEKLEAIEKEE
ncbi:MAG: TraR/DksA C4-type zinc finger protein [Nitrospirota bacterium]